MTANGRRLDQLLAEIDHDLTPPTRGSQVKVPAAFSEIPYSYFRSARNDRVTRTDQQSVRIREGRYPMDHELIVGGSDRPHNPGVDEATGFSKKLSFDEAFADAVAKLPPIEPPVADALSQVHVLEIGGRFGGIAGFHDLFVRVSRTHDG